MLLPPVLLLSLLVLVLLLQQQLQLLATAGVRNADILLDNAGAQRRLHAQLPHLLAGLQQL
jgi:hypothetical protein